MRKLIAHTTLALATALALPMAQAKPVTRPATAATSGAATCSLDDLGGWASACLGYVDGNDSNDALSSLAGSTSWNGLSLDTLSRLKDQTPGAGSTNTLFDVRQSSSDASRGQLTFLQNLAGPFVLTLKGGNSWAAYFRADGATAGSTITFDIPGEQGSGLSHASVYAASFPTPDLRVTTNPVPEPASAALVLLALAGLGGSRWLATRRRRATA